LKPTVQILAKKLVHDLRQARKRKEKQVWYKSPITGDKLCQAYKNAYSWKLSTVDIRNAVHYARTELMEFIGSNSKGYFYVLNPDEWECTERHLKNRIIEISKPYSAVRKLKKIQIEQKHQMNFQKHPVLEKLIEEFDAIPHV
jgi:hypothetical protein